MSDPRQQLRRLFDQALELPAAERGAFLAAACGSDRTLELRLQAMLAAAEDERFLADPTGAEPVPPPSAAAVAAEGSGTWIGPYKLLQQIGEGGFGVVFLAEQRQPVSRRVALKIVKLGMDTKQVVARFEQERQALALMDHAHIARVLDAGATATGRPYFVMDLVEGAPIVEYCDTNKLTIAERLEVFTQVCLAVQHAHGKGVIHRDLKPSNVLVATKDGRPQAKVIDFGIAKATSQRLTDKTLFTEHQQVIGTLQYMSPEQAVGSLDIDTRTDVYSLGILLYELLTGSTPFDRRTLQDAMLGEIQRIIRDVEPPKPSTRLQASQTTLASIAAHRRIEPRRLGLLLRGELDWIVMKALEKDRSRRYETAAGLAQDVRRHLDGFEVTAAPPSVGYRVRTFTRRHRVAVAAGGAVLLSLLLGVAGFAWQASAAADERDRAVALQQSEAQARRLAQENEKDAVEQAVRAEIAQQAETKARARAETISEFVTAALMSGDAMNAGGGQSVTVLDAMDAAIADLESGRFDADKETEASLRRTISIILRNNGRVEQALALAEIALALRQELHPDDHVDVASSLCDVGMALDACGRKPEAEQFFVRSLAMYERLLPGDNKHVAALLNNIGEVRNGLGRARDGEPMLVRSVEMHRRLDLSDRSSLAKSLDNLASTRSLLGAHAEAEQLYREALTLRRDVYPGDHPDLAVGLNNLATELVHLDRKAEAEPLFTEALEMRRRLFRGDHPAVAQGLANLGLLRSDVVSPEAAEPLLVEALAMHRRLFPGDHPSTAHTLFSLAALHLQRGDLAAGEPIGVEALAMHERLYTDNHVGTALSHSNLARIQHGLGRPAEARPHFDAAVAVLRQLPGAAGLLLDVLGRSALARVDTGDFAAAVPELEQVVDLAKQRLPPTSEKLATYRQALERCQAELAAGRK